MLVKSFELASHPATNRSLLFCCAPRVWPGSIIASARWGVALSLCLLLQASAWGQFKLPWQQTAAPKPPANVASTTPHPAVARIVVPEHEERSVITGSERQSVSYGSGSLVDVRGDFGLVITNWHVVRDAVGEVTVQFPDGFRSPANIVKVDKDWDLAALSIRRPANVVPISIATNTVQPGEPLAIAGYGAGDYRMAVGKMTQYLSPGERFPFEMIELDVEARHGDSGGPILNQRGEIAGVLFGAGRGFTSGTYSGRVSGFLVGVIPEQRDAGNGALAQASSNPAAAATAAGGWAPRSPNSIAKAAVPAVPAVPFNDPAKDRVAAVGQAGAARPLAVETLALHPQVTGPKSSPYDITKPAAGSNLSPLGSIKTPLSGANSSVGVSAPADLGDQTAGKVQTVVAKPVEADGAPASQLAPIKSAAATTGSDTALLYPLAENDAAKAKGPDLGGEASQPEVDLPATGGVPPIDAKRASAPRVAANIGRPKSLAPTMDQVAEDAANTKEAAAEPGSATSLAPRGGVAREKVLVSANPSTEEVMTAVWHKVGGTTTFDQGKTILAMVGILTILVKWYRWNYASDPAGEDD